MENNNAISAIIYNTWIHLIINANSVKLQYKIVVNAHQILRISAQNVLKILHLINYNNKILTKTIYA